MSGDLYNGLFELGSGLLSSINIYRLYRDRVLRGVSILPTIFFSCWGLWNLYFYRVNDAPYSFYGGCVITIVNVIWLSQIWYYSRK